MERSDTNAVSKKKNQKTVIIICGPTASGKTSLSIELAKKLNTFVISADSRQVFREMHIGTGRILREEMQGILHFLSGHKSITDEYHAGIFEEEALEVCEQVFSIKDTIVMCGGTGLYIRAFCEGLDDMVESNPEVRAALQEGFEKNGIEWLQQQVKEKDPLYYNKADIQNHQRLMRALEVMIQSGKPYSDYRTGEKRERDFRIVKFGIDPGRDELYEKINKRVDKMISKGLEEEARAMYPHRHLNALDSVGYTEWFEHFDGKMTRDETIEKIKQHTRNYAKRQMTWFKREEGLQWISPEKPEAALKIILNSIK